MIGRNVWLWEPYYRAALLHPLVIHRVEHTGTDERLRCGEEVIDDAAEVGCIVCEPHVVTVVGSAEVGRL